MFWRAILSYYNLFTSHLVADRTTNISAQRDVPLPNSSPMTWRMSSHLSPGCSTLPVHHGTQIGYETPADAVLGANDKCLLHPRPTTISGKDFFFFFGFEWFPFGAHKKRKRPKHVLVRSNCPRVFKCWRPSLRLIAIVTCWGERVLDKREKMGGRFIAPQKRLFESSPPPLVLFPSHQPVVCVYLLLGIRRKFLFSPKQPDPLPTSQGNDRVKNSSAQLARWAILPRSLSLLTFWNTYVISPCRLLEPHLFLVVVVAGGCYIPSLGKEEEEEDGDQVRPYLDQTVRE